MNLLNRYAEEYDLNQLEVLGVLEWSKQAFWQTSVVGDTPPDQGDEWRGGDA